MGAEPWCAVPVTFLVYGPFRVPHTDNRNYIIIHVPDRTALTMPWSTQILPAVARLVQPWMPMVERRRVLHREERFGSSIEYSTTEMVAPDLKDVRLDIHLDGGSEEGGADLLKITSTRRYVWRDKKLEEVYSP